jgi:hypothetical protein
LLICFVPRTGKSEDGIYSVCQDYIDAFYLGDTLAVKRIFSEHLNKFGYSMNDETLLQEFKGYMTCEQFYIEFLR